MPRERLHRHPCQSCGVPVECSGAWERNYDGFPEVICPEFHLADGELNRDFVCEACPARQEAAHAADLAEQDAETA